MQYDWDFSVLADPATQRFLLQGLLTTLQLTAWCIVVGTPLGVLLGSLPFLHSLVGSPERSSLRQSSGVKVVSSVGRLGRVQVIAHVLPWLKWRSVPSLTLRL